MPGEAYRTYETYWDKTVVKISDRKLSEVAQQAWRENKSFVGVNAETFVTLKEYYRERFGSLDIKEPSEEFGIMKK